MVSFDMLRVLATAVALFSPTPAPSTPPEIAHVVTSDRSDRTLRTTTRTTFIVTADEIARRGYRTVGDALAELPGVQIDRYGPIGSAVSYGIRGSSSAQVLVLIDGLPATGELGNTVQLGTLSTAGVRRIEVVEGGGSTLYGTGAVGGIINVITDGSRVPVNATMRVGSFGDRSLRAEGFGLTFERTVAQNEYGYPPSIDPVSGGPAATDRANGDYQATTLRYGTDRRVGAVDLALRTSLESDRLGAPGFFPYVSPTSREDDVNANASLSFSLARSQSAPTLQIGGGRQQIFFRCNAATDANCFQAAPSLSTEARSLLSLRDVIHGAHERTIYGVDLSRGVVRADSGDGTSTGIATAAVAQSAAYVQQNWETQRGELYAGLRAERDGALGGEFSPSIGARQEFGTFVVKANAATAFRAPNASELYFPGYGNPALVPERAQVGDLSLTDRALLGGVTFGWFTNRTNDLIVATPLPSGAYAPKNVAHARMQGFTLDAQTQALHGVRAAVTVTDLYRAENVDAASRLPNDPVFSVNTRLTFAPQHPAVFEEAGVLFRAVGGRGFVDPTQPLFDQPAAYSTVDAYARFRVASRALVTVRGFNLGNERYAEIGGYPLPGRSFSVELSTR